VTPNIPFGIDIIHSCASTQLLININVHTKFEMFSFPIPKIWLDPKIRQELSSCWDGQPFGHNRQ